MKEFDAAAAGDRWAGIYDDWHPEYEEAAIAMLASLARDGRALELGIGTGRMALPLAERGVEVNGIEASPAMVARLRARPGGAAIPVTLGDFADLEVEGRFSLIFVVFNTLFAIPSQEAQVRCFCNVAAHLTEGGAFVVEAFVPDPARFSRGQAMEAVRVESNRVVLGASRHDPVHQRIDSQHVVIAGAVRRSTPFGCATPGRPNWT